MVISPVLSIASDDDEDEDDDEDDDEVSACDLVPLFSLKP